MRVGQVTREYPPNVYGGAGVHVEYLSRELSKLIKVDVHCWGTQEIDTDPNLHIHGGEPWPLLSEGTTEKYKTAIEALSLNLLQVERLKRAEIVHTHTWYVSMAGMLAKMLYGIPFVLTTHSLEPLRAWKAEQLGTGYTLSSWMERTAILEADAVVAVSNGTKEDILRAYPELPPERIHVIYNGIDLDEYQKTPDTGALTKFGVNPSQPYVLFVGRITRQKGILHLVEAIGHLPPMTQVVLAAGAPDTPEIEQEMRLMIENVRETNPAVHWIDHMITKGEAIELYSNCAVFCCPSVYEPFGIINLEAMACRAPVVASAIGGIPEVVVDNETGYLVPFEQDPVTAFPTDPAKFARDLAVKIASMLSDPEKARSFGEAGRRRAEDKFAWSAIAAQTRDLYQSLLRDRTQMIAPDAPPSQS